MAPHLDTSRADLEEARARLEGHELCGRIMANATTRIRADSLLSYNGANVTQWTRDIKELAPDHLSDSHFFTRPCENSIFERIGRAIILFTLRTDLQNEFQDCISSYHIFRGVIKKCNNVSRVAQMNVWRRFMSFRWNDDMSIVGVSAQLRGWLWEWTNLHVDLNRDTFLAFIVQNSLPSGSRLKDKVDRRIEHLMLEDDKRQITLPAILGLIESCRQQFRHDNLDSTNTTSAFNAGAVEPTLTLPVTFPDIRYPLEAYLEDIPEELWDQAISFYASRAAKCWTCGSNQHWKKDCPNKR